MQLNLYTNRKPIRKIVNECVHIALIFLLVCISPSALWASEPFNMELAREPGDFMPEHVRKRIFLQLQTQDWAKAEYNRIRKAARKPDGWYWAAFLYALEKSPEYLPIAQEWLLKFGDRGGDLGKRALEADDAFYKKGQPWLGDVYYCINLKPYLAYAWVYDSFTRIQRKQIEKGFLASARFRMRAMERWSQTANLVFKPTCMVAAAGLVTGDPELIQWGFYRRSLMRPTHGGYFQVLDHALKDEGPWFEAPIYAIAQKPLFMMNQISKLLYLKDGQNWFAHQHASGGSPKGLVDYYLDTAYPMETSGCGKARLRVATYGDGSTNAEGDLFLIDPCDSGINMHDELASAYDLSGDKRYAAFLQLMPDYHPNLFDRRPLPANPDFPDAPSHIWPDFGIAMLRSDETPSYWTNDSALAVFQIMSQGYGHGHRDQFSIMLFGCGRLLYPDYNVKQYENPAVGWSRNIVAHNTLTVDEQESRDAEPTAIRHAFTPGLKFLATSASQVFRDVDQTRALFLTDRYLLDIFSASGKTVHTYDYLLHSFGRPYPGAPKQYHAGKFSARYHQVEQQRQMTTDGQWQLDFRLDAEPASTEAVGVRLTMAGSPKTRVVYGDGPDHLAALIVRRGRIPATTFTALHEPYKSSSHPQVRRVTVLAQSKAAILVCVEADRFTDYAAVATDPKQSERLHVMAARDGSQIRASFRDYAYLHIPLSGRIIKTGHWEGARLPLKASSITGKPSGHGPIRIKNGMIEFGDIPARADAPLQIETTISAPVEITPSPVRMFRNDKHTVVFQVRNKSKAAVTLKGRIEPEPSQGFRFTPPFPDFGPIPPGGSAEVKVTLNAYRAPKGQTIIPFRLASFQGPDKPKKYSAPLSLTVMVEPVLTSVYRHPEPSVYRVYAPLYTLETDMRHGLIRYLADDDNTVRLRNQPLFTFGDGQKSLLNENTQHAFTWVHETPASLLAHAEDRCRWKAIFMGDRLVIKMDPDWTQFERTFFNIPGQWVAPQGTPSWRQVRLASGASGSAQIGAAQKLMGAELAFPKAAWHICFQFEPAQEVVLTPTGMSFSIGSLNEDEWTVGFCRPGQLEKWLWR